MADTTSDGGDAAVTTLEDGAGNGMESDRRGRALMTVAGAAENLGGEG